MTTIPLPNSTRAVPAAAAADPTPATPAALAIVAASGSEVAVRRNWYQIAADILSIIAAGLATTATSTSLGLSPRATAALLIAISMDSVTIAKLSGYAKQQAIADAPNEPTR